MQQVGQQVGHDDPTQVVGRRIVAAALDLAVLALVAFAVFVVVAERQPAWVGQGLACADHGPGCLVVGDTVLVATGGRLDLVAAATALFGIATFVVRRGRSGRSLGMDALGLVVVGDDGAPPGIGTALVRTLVGWVDYLPVCLPLVGLATMATSPGHQRVGDLAAATVVVRRQRAGAAGLVPPRRSEGGAPDLASSRTGRRAVRWGATAVGGLVSAAVLARLWTLDLTIDGQACGTVVTAVGRCDPVGTAFVAALTLGFASIPLLVVAGPLWLVELHRRRRAGRITATG